MPIGASRQAVHSIYHSIHIYDGFCLMNPVLIIIRVLISCTRFIYSFMYSIHILIHVLISYTHSCTYFIYLFMYSFHILIHVLVSFTHSCTRFIYLYVLLVLYQTVLSPVGVQNQDSSSDTRRYFSYLCSFTYQIYIYCYFLFISTSFLTMYSNYL